MCVDLIFSLGVFEKEITRDNIPILKCKDEPQAPSIRDVTRLEVGCAPQYVLLFVY